MPFCLAVPSLGEPHAVLILNLFSSFPIPFLHSFTNVTLSAGILLSFVPLISTLPIFCRMVWNTFSVSYTWVSNIYRRNVEGQVQWVSLCRLARYTLTRAPCNASVLVFEHDERCLLPHIIEHFCHYLPVFFLQLRSKVCMLAGLSTGALKRLLVFGFFVIYRIGSPCQSRLWLVRCLW